MKQPTKPPKKRLVSAALALWAGASTLTACGAAPSTAPVEPWRLAPPPWVRPPDTDARVKALINMPTITSHGEAKYHLHTHLDVFHEGAPVLVPGGIGLGEKMAAVHTHDASGVIHMETVGEADYTIGHLFDLWNVPLTGADAYADGARVEDPGGIRLRKHQEIVIIYGKPPEVIPTRYEFPAGYAMK